jgi:hypothetical protein
MTALDKAGLVALADTGCDDDRIWRAVPVEALRSAADAMTAPTVAEIAGMLTKAQKRAAKVCRHADPRCIEDPCPYGIWQVLCKPPEAAHIAAQIRENDDAG